MGRFCCVVGCSNRSDRESKLSYYLIPGVIKHQGEETEKLSAQRRDQWIANIRRDAVKNGDITYPHVCSIHFHEGKSSFYSKNFGADFSKNACFQSYVKIMLCFRKTGGFVQPKPPRLGSDEGNGA